MEESLRPSLFRSVFRSVWGFEGDETLKNLANTGENELEPVVGIEPTTYGLRIRRQFLEYAKTAANVHFIEMVEVCGLACLTCSTVAQCCAEAFDPARGFDKVPLWMIR